MNLVAKEFVAARDDEQGVLVLSHFTGAARELPEALDRQPVRPRRGAATRSQRALTMPPAEQRDAHARACAASSPSSTSTAGPARMLLDAERLRRRERMAGRFDGSEDTQPEMAFSGTEVR